jgi:hypothetical protein
MVRQEREENVQWRNPAILPRYRLAR